MTARNCSDITEGANSRVFHSSESHGILELGIFAEANA